MRRGSLLSVVLVALVASVVSMGAGARRPSVPPSAPPGPGVFTSLSPARLLDTRTGAGIATVDGAGLGAGKLSAGASRAIPVLNRGGVPATGVGAVVLNVTAVNATTSTFLTVYPGAEALPSLLTSNFGQCGRRTCRTS